MLILENSVNGRLFARIYAACARVAGFSRILANVPYAIRPFLTAYSTAGVYHAAPSAAVKSAPSP